MASVAPVAADRMDRFALALLAAGHLSVDLCQGAVPAMLPFFIRERQLSYAAAAGLVLAALSSRAKPSSGVWLTSTWPVAAS